MKLKKSLAVLLSAVLMLSFLPMFASASDVPSVLYVGETGKTEDNLIRMCDDANGNKVTVHSVNKDSSYYTVEKDKNIGYILTFYNNYQISEPVNRFFDYYGVFCDGNLTIRVRDGVTIDMNRKFEDVKYDYASGIYVGGTLTIEGIGNKPVMQVCGDKKKNAEGAVGIYAETVLLHNIEVRAAGGNTAVMSDKAVAMIDANLYSNNTPDMKDNNEKPLFEYGLVTETFIQVRGDVEICGKIQIDAYDFHGGTHTFDTDVVVYLRNYEFTKNGNVDEKTYDGLWRNSFDLFVNASEIPACIKLYKDGKSSVVTVTGNKATLSNRGAATLRLVLVCGTGTYEMDAFSVNCNLAWWQWLPYIFSGAWLNK